MMEKPGWIETGWLWIDFGIVHHRLLRDAYPVVDGNPDTVRERKWLYGLPACAD
jgi:hypothetical protein